MVLQNRRKFLQKALGVGAIAVASAATAAKLKVNANPVPQGKSKKQEVLWLNRTGNGGTPQSYFKTAAEGNIQINRGRMTGPLPNFIANF